MKLQPKSFIPAIAGLALGAVVIASTAGGALAAKAPPWETLRPAMASQLDAAVAPLGDLKSYRYTLDIKATGTEALYMAEDYSDLVLQPGDRFAMTVDGVVVGPNARTSVSIGSGRDVMWLKGDAFERKVNNDALEEWDGPFEKTDFEDYSLYAAEQYWDDALLPWFEANRANFVCQVSALPNGGEARECAYDGRDDTALWDLLDAVSYGSFDDFTRIDVKATFMAGVNAPTSVSIFATGADELSGATSLELTLKVSDINNGSLSLPASPSGK